MSEMDKGTLLREHVSTSTFGKFGNEKKSKPKMVGKTAKENGGSK